VSDNIFSKVIRDGEGMSFEGEVRCGLALFGIRAVIISYFPQWTERKIKTVRKTLNRRLRKRYNPSGLQRLEG
jgi:hypothetical protein